LLRGVRGHAAAAWLAGRYGSRNAVVASGWCSFAGLQLLAAPDLGLLNLRGDRLRPVSAGST